MIKKPSIYLVRLKPDAKMTPNHYGHRYFHSKAELKTWMKDNESIVHDISLAKWEEVNAVSYTHLTLPTICSV